MIDFFLGITFGILLVAVPAFLAGVITARMKDKNK